MTHLRSFHETVFIPNDLTLNWSLQEVDCTAPGALVTDFNIWDRSMGDIELIHWTSCHDLNKGNLVDWEDSSWDLDEGMEWIEMPAEEVCILPRPRDIIFPEYRTYEDMLLLCNKLSGTLSVTDGQTKQDDLVNEFMRKLPEDFTGYQSSMFWAGYNDNVEQGCNSIRRYLELWAQNWAQNWD